MPRGRPRADAPKTRILTTRVTDQEGAIFDQLLAQRRQVLGVAEDEYTESHFLRWLIRERAKEAGLVQDEPAKSKVRKRRTSTPRA